MNITVDLPVSLLAQARRRAAESNTTVTSLVERSLCEFLARSDRSDHYVLPKASVHGAGLSAEFGDASWDDIIAASYGASR